MDPKESEEFYAKLKGRLEETSSWPSDFLYKFIVPTEKDKIDRINKVFDNMGAVIESKQSRKGKYTSISVTVNLKDPDDVIQKYKEVGLIEGVISL